MIPVFINIMNDISLGVLTHNAIQPPMPSPVVNGSVEMVATQLWPPGMALGQNKFTTTVLHKGQWIVQDGHDCGAMIPDVTIPIVGNLLYTVNWPFSSRKITFSAMAVKMNDKPVGCSQPGPVPLPMMTCGDPVSGPTALPIINPLNTVIVTMSLADLLLGILNIGLSMAIDFAFEYVKKLGGSGVGNAASDYKKAFVRTKADALKKATKTGTKHTMKAVGVEAAKKIVPISKKGWAKKCVNAAAGLLMSSLKGNPTFKMSVGPDPFVSLEAGIGGDAGGPFAKAMRGPKDWGASL